METVLEVTNLYKKFPYKTNFFGKTVKYLNAVNGVNFKLHKNEILGLVGESGCGKSTLGKTIVSLEKPSSGNSTINIDGEKIDLNSLDGKKFRKYKRYIRMLFQDPFTSLNPRLPVKDIIAEPLHVHYNYNKYQITEKVSEIMLKVGLDPNYMKRYPHSFSGGQRQRIAFARALIMHPKILVADEPVSALDVSIQAQIINLILQLKKEFQLSIIFISHDLSVVDLVSDRIAVMYFGEIVEIGDKKDIINNPKHPYTEALLSAVPIPNNNNELNNIKLTGELPSPLDKITGCVFSSRCAYTQEICKKKIPEFNNNIKKNHFYACHFDQNLKGINSYLEAND